MYTLLKNYLRPVPKNTFRGNWGQALNTHLGVIGACPQTHISPLKKLDFSDFGNKKALI